MVPEMRALALFSASRPVLRTEGLRKGAASLLTEIRLAQRGSYARRVQEGATVGDGEDARGTEGWSRAGGESGEE